MLGARKLKGLYEACMGHRDSSGQLHGNPRGRTEFVNRIRHWLGLCSKQGVDYKDRLGNRILREAKDPDNAMAPEEVSFQELAIATCGYENYERFFNPVNRAGLDAMRRHNSALLESFDGDGRALLEAAGVGVDVSAFADINAWTAATGGLLERMILQAFENPDYIGDSLMESQTTKIAEGQKVIGVSRIGDKALERQPGEAHARAPLVERWVQLGKTRENSLGIDVYKETAFFDLTGQALEHAGQHGDWLRYRKEIDQLSAFLGITTGVGPPVGKWAFNYKGTYYATYSTSQLVQPSGVNLGYISQLAGNDLVDWKSIEAAWLILQRQTDPETGTRVMVKPDTVVINPARLATAKILFGATETERRTALSSTVSTTGDLHVARTPGNVVNAFGSFGNALWSPLLEQLCTNPTNDPASPGLGLSQANANQNWWWFNKGRFMKYMINWPLTIVQAPATSYDMIDRGIIMSVFGDERGMPSVHSPWHMLNSTQ